MAQPSPYTPTTDFSADEAGNAAGRSTVRTAQLDAEFENIDSTIDEILVNLELNQRDDGEIRDGRVKLHTLSSEVLALIGSGAFTVRGAWLTATAYTLGDVVLQGGVVYVAIEAHTSGTFATDLAAGKWGAITDQPTAAEVPFSPTASLSSSNVQAAIEELDTDVRPGQSILHQQLFNGL